MTHPETVTGHFRRPEGGPQKWDILGACPAFRERFRRTSLPALLALGLSVAVCYLMHRNHFFHSRLSSGLLSPLLRS